MKFFYVCINPNPTWKMNEMSAYRVCVHRCLDVISIDPPLFCRQVSHVLNRNLKTIRAIGYFRE